VISRKQIFPYSPHKDINVQRIAYLLSLVLHPLLLPSAFIAVLFFFTTSVVVPVSQSLRLPFLGIIFIMTFIFPMCTAAIWLLSRQLQTPPAKPRLGDDDAQDTSSEVNLHMQNRRDRRWVFVFTSVIYIMATVLFELKAKNPFITLVLTSITLSLILLTIITFFWKISAHSVGMSGILGMLVGFNYQLGEGVLFYPILISIVLVGLIMTVRLYLDAHNIEQVVAGFVLGFVVNLLTVLLLY
jgi:membrane-associated phospholipid phosphatase